MRLVTVGLSHHRAGVGLRGRVALAEPEARCLVQNLAHAGAREAVVLSTCNRTELYLGGPDAANLTTLGVRELSELVGVDPRELEPVLYRLTDATAALHLNRVAAGLDSLVPGEAQVLGQVRAALRLAESEGTAGHVLSRAFQRALETGKRARSETAISEGNASVASVAASLADGALGGLSGRSALVVGAGRTSELAALNLMSRGLRRLSVANRTYQSACVLAGRLGGSAVHFEDVAQQLHEVDVVVSSTAAPHAVLRTDMVAPALVGPHGTPRLPRSRRALRRRARRRRARRLRGAHPRRPRARDRPHGRPAPRGGGRGRGDLRRRGRGVPGMAGRAHRRTRDRPPARRRRGPARGRGRTPRGRPRPGRARALRAALAPARRQAPAPSDTRLRESASGPDGVQYAETALDLFGLADDPAYP